MLTGIGSGLKNLNIELVICVRIYVIKQSFSISNLTFVQTSLKSYIYREEVDSQPW